MRNRSWKYRGYIVRLGAPGRGSSELAGLRAATWFAYDAEFDERIAVMCRAFILTKSATDMIDAINAEIERCC